MTDTFNVVETPSEPPLIEPPARKPHLPDDDADQYWRRIPGIRPDPDFPDDPSEGEKTKKP